MMKVIIFVIHFFIYKYFKHLLDFFLQEIQTHLEYLVIAVVSSYPIVAGGWGRHDHIVVGFQLPMQSVPITTKANGEVY